MGELRVEWEWLGTNITASPLYECQATGPPLAGYMWKVKGSLPPFAEQGSVRKTCGRPTLIGRRDAETNTLRFFSQLHSSLAGPEGVPLRSLADMPQFAYEASVRVCIQQLGWAAEFR